MHVDVYRDIVVVIVVDLVEPSTTREVTTDVACLHAAVAALAGDRCHIERDTARESEETYYTAKETYL